VWHNIFHLGVSWQEKATRAILIYAFLLVAIRLFGRRELGQLTAFDLIVLLTLSNILQNAMIGHDDSMSGGVIAAIVLLSANYSVAFATFRNRKAERVVVGLPKILIHDGVLQREAIRSELLTDQELLSAVRREGLESFDEVKLAVSEPNGLISIIPRRSG
jgi:uncharacterized membrane protein YcaP (DUF421 family)